jgi:hypothetical protein
MDQQVPQSVAKQLLPQCPEGHLSVIVQTTEKNGITGEVNGPEGHCTDPLHF